VTAGSSPFPRFVCGGFRGCWVQREGCSRRLLWCWTIRVHIGWIGGLTFAKSEIEPDEDELVRPDGELRPRDMSRQQCWSGGVYNTPWRSMRSRRVFGAWWHQSNKPQRYDGILRSEKSYVKWRLAIQVFSENKNWHSPVLILYSIKVLTSESALQHVSIRHKMILDEMYHRWLTTWLLSGYYPITCRERLSRSRRQWRNRLARYRGATWCR
jgi:hypothetical protein